MERLTALGRVIRSTLPPFVSFQGFIYGAFSILDHKMQAVMCRLRVFKFSAPHKSVNNSVWIKRILVVQAVLII